MTTRLLLAGLLASLVVFVVWFQWPRVGPAPPVSTLCATGTAQDRPKGASASTDPVPMFVRPTTAFLSGQVFGDAGHPIGGASVDAVLKSQRICGQAGSTRDLTIAVATSGNQGRFELPSPDLHKLPADFSLVVGAANHSVLVLDSVEPGQFVTIRLEACATIHGRVEFEPPLRGSREHLVRVSQEWGDTETQCDRSGSFELQISSGQARITVVPTAGGIPRPYVVTLEPGESREVNFRVLEEESVSGTVLDSATMRPILGASVGFRNPFEYSVQTDENGSFTLGRLGPNVVPMIYAEAEGYGCGAQIIIDRNETAVFLLDPSEVVRGRVVASDGLPLPGAQVALLASQRPRAFLSRGKESHAPRSTINVPGSRSSFSVTDDEGFFDLATPSLGPGMLLAVTQPAYSLQVYALTLPERGPLHMDDIVVGLASTVRCKIVGTSGDPLGGVEVNISLLRDDVDHLGHLIPPLLRRLIRLCYEKTTATDVNGIARFRGLSLREYVVRIEDPEYLESSVVVSITESGSVTDIVLEADPGLSVVGTVRNPEGELLTGIQVVLDQEERQQPWRSRAQRSDAHGVFRFSGLPPATYLVRTVLGSQHPEYADALTVGVRPGTEPIVLEIARRSSIHGIVVSESDGAPISGAQVSLFELLSDSQRGAAGVVTDEHGRFQFVVAKDRAYQIIAWPSAQKWTDVKSGGDLERVVNSPNRETLGPVSSRDSPIEIRLRRW